MKSTGIVRQVDELGRIVIPKEMRTNLGLMSGDPVEIYVDGEQIILKKYQNACIFCGQGLELLSFKEKKICKTCMNELKE